MKLSDLKALVNKLENSGITDDFELTFRANISDSAQAIEIVDFEVDSSERPFDIGHSDKTVGIFIEEIF